MTNFGTRFLATLGVALLAFVALVAPAGASTSPAPRYFTASERNVTSWHVVNTWVPESCTDYGYWDTWTDPANPAWIPDVLCDPGYWDSNIVYDPDVLLVRIYNYTHTIGYTYSCYNPTKSSSVVSNPYGYHTYTDTWSSPSCAPPKGTTQPRRAFKVSFVDTLGAAAEHTLYVSTAGFLPYLSHTYRYKCVNARDTYTSASTWYGDTYAAVKPCPVG